MALFVRLLPVEFTRFLSQLLSVKSSELSGCLKTLSMQNRASKNHNAASNVWFSSSIPVQNGSNVFRLRGMNETCVKFRLSSANADAATIKKKTYEVANVLQVGYQNYVYTENKYTGPILFCNLKV